MALLFLDSFDHYVTADLLTKWTASVPTNAGVGTSIQAIAAIGRRGTNGLQLRSARNAGSSGSVTKTLAPTGTTAVVGVAVNWTGASPPFQFPAVESPCLIALRLAGATQVWLSLETSSGLISAYRGATSLGASSAGLVAGSTAYLELSAVVATGTGGSVTVRLNGTPVLTLTSINTANSGASGWDSVRLGPITFNSGGTTGTDVEFDYDDLYVLDGSGAAPWNTFLGDVRADVRLPTGAGATTGWTPSTGANWAAVDDAAPNGDTDYTSTSTVGVTDTFVTQDAPVVGATIFGVQHCLSVKKTDAGACSVAPVIRHSGVDYPGAAIAPGTNYAYGLQIAQTNPGTSAAWTEAGFNAAEFGYRRTA